MMLRRELGLLFLLQCGGAAEQPPINELVVVVDSDLDVPSAVDRIVVVADGDAGVVERSGSFGGDGGLTLPLTLGVTAKTTKAATFTATAFQGEKMVVSRQIRASFPANESRTAPLMLCGSCRDRVCPAGQTCGERGCQSIDITNLAPWTGRPPPRPRCGGCLPGDSHPRPMRAFDASNPNFPHACNVTNVLDEDDKVAGLDYASGGNTIGEIQVSLKDIADKRLSGCVAVDFGSPFSLDPIIVRARKTATRSACEGPCETIDAPALPARGKCSTCDATESNTGKLYCERPAKMLVFAGVRFSELAYIGAASNVEAAFESYTFEAKRPVQFVVACRGEDGPAAPDVEVDVIKTDAPCPP